MNPRPAWLAGRSILLIAIVLLAALLRIAAIAYTHGTQAAPEENRLIARNLAAGRGFTFTEFGVTGPTAIRGPAYPMLLAVVGPDRVGLILAINVVAGAASVVAAAALTKRLLSPLPEYREREPALWPPTAPPRAVWIAAVLFAVWPTQLYAATLTQGLSIAVFLALAAFTLAWRRTPPALITAGLLAGLAALTEPVLALPLLLSAIVLGWRRHWPDTALFVGTAIVLIAPWLYRNAVIFDGPMPITSNFWRDALLGIGRDGLTGGIDQRRVPIPGTAAEFGKPDDLFKRLPPFQFDRLKVPESDRILIYRERVLRSIRAQPAQYAWNCVGRLFGGTSNHPLRSHALFLFSYPILGLLMMIGSSRSQCRLQWRWLVLPGSVLVGLTLGTTFTNSAPRNVVMSDIGSLLMVAVVMSSHPLGRRKFIAGPK